jgi:hypothetical protein
VGRLIVDTSGYLAGTAAKHPLSETIQDILRTAVEPPVISPLVLAEIDYMVLDKIGVTPTRNTRQATAAAGTARTMIGRSMRITGITGTQARWERPPGRLTRAGWAPPSLRGSRSPTGGVGIFLTDRYKKSRIRIHGRSCVG